MTDADIRTRLLFLLQAGSFRLCVECAGEGISANHQTLFCHYILGYCAAVKGEVETAKSHLHAALSKPCDGQQPLEPGDAQQATLSLATIHDSQGNKPLASAVILQSIKSHGIYPSLANDIGNLLTGCECFEEAEQCYRAATSVQAVASTALNNLGNLMILTGKADQSIDQFLGALEDDPNNAQTHSNLATAYDELGEIERARQHHTKALSLDEQAPKIHLNFALHLLRRQRVAEALPHFQFRFAARGDQGSGLRHGATTSLNGDCVVLSEQGIGDELHLLYLLAQLSPNGTWAYVGDPRLEPMFVENFPNARFISSNNFNLAIDPRNRSGFYRLNDALWDLRAHTKRYNRLTMPQETDAQDWKARLQKLGKGIKIGISFSGGIRQRDYIKRNMPARFWRGLSEINNARLIDIQYNNLPDQRSEISQSTGMEIVRFAEYDPIKKLTQGLGLLSCLDTIITVDNSTAHIAGVFGLKGAVVLNNSPDWRWGLKSETSFLYPTVKLLRQVRYGDWQSVMHKMQIMPV